MSARSRAVTAPLRGLASVSQTGARLCVVERSRRANVQPADAHHGLELIETAESDVALELSGAEGVSLTRGGNNACDVREVGQVMIAPACACSAVPDHRRHPPLTRP